jgi:oxygen-independent coproporphyrinogen-3 oxidase
VSTGSAWACRASFAQAAEAFREAREAGFDNISADLIYGAPYQSLQSWRKSLDAVLAWEPDHISFYSLTLEPDTPLHHRVMRGLVPHPDPDLAADMYDDARERLARAGLKQVEISNWARPGYECQHNRQYWLNRPFLGFGAGAHGAANGLRYWNVDPVPGYIKRVSAGESVAPRFPLSPAVADFEIIGERLAMSETMILGLRLVAEGVSKADFARRFGHPPDSIFGPVIANLARTGLLASDRDHLRLTERAYLISNRVFAQFLP